MKGYSRKKFISKLHLSQPTSSRDSAFLYDQFKQQSVKVGKATFKELDDWMSGTN